MNTNYFTQTGYASVLHHYNIRFISSSENKLFYKILEQGVIPNTGVPITVNDEGVSGTSGTQILIPQGFSFVIAPNNKLTSNETIKNNFLALYTTEANILDRQILKCDIIKDFYIPSNGSSGYIVAEYNYLEYPDLEVSFSIIDGSELNEGYLILGYVDYAGSSGYVTAVDTSEQTMASLNSEILYEMNVDKLQGYRVMDGFGYSSYSGYSGVSGWSSETGSVFIPLSDGLMASGLNAEMVNGYSGYEAATKWEMNSGLNAEFIADIYSGIYQPGNQIGNIPLSNKIINLGLNAHFVGGSGYSSFAETDHQHTLSGLSEAGFYRRVSGVSSSHYATNSSFETGAFTKEKINDECFFAHNDDQGGSVVIVTGQTTSSQ
jgi:hypothetical protein